MTATTQPTTGNRLEHFPVTFFAIVMGLSGLTLALHAADPVLGFGGTASTVFFFISLAVFVAIAALYGLKSLQYPGQVLAEWNHPVRLSFFPAISISLLLLGTAALGRLDGLAQALWIIGMVGQGVLTIAVVSGWIGHRSFQTPTLSPAWFIPAVGNVIVPIGGVPLGFVEISWYFMSVGLIFWLVLLTLVVNRLIFHDPLPGKLQPTLVILIAPPAVAFVAWLRLNGGEVDAMGRLLINTAYLFSLIVAVQLPRILKLPFALSFWALSFPVAAATIASFRFATLTGSAAHKVIAIGLLAVLALIIAGLVARTLMAIRAGEICQPE